MGAPGARAQGRCHPERPPDGALARLAGEAYHRGMHIQLSDADHALMDRYFRSVLIRYKDGGNDLMEATEELAQAFSQVARGDRGFLDHMLGVVEAGDDA